MHTSHYSRETDYTACHPRKSTTYVLHVVPITTHTHDRRKSIGEKKQIKERILNQREEKTRKRKNEKESEKRKKTRRATKDKTRRGSKER